jgi:CRP/FNR family cyclic AMP-dependent transcriptional regulator
VFAIFVIWITSTARSQRYAGRNALETLLQQHRGPQMLNSADLASVEFKRGETIFEKGDPPNACAYIIESGRVAIKSSVGAIEVSVEALERGDFIGEISLIDDEPRSASDVAEEDTICSIITKHNFDKALEDADLLAHNLVKVLTNRLRKMTERGDLFFSDDDEDED